MCLTNSRLRIWGSTDCPVIPHILYMGLLDLVSSLTGLSCLNLIIFYSPVGGGVNGTVLHLSLELCSFLKNEVLLCFRLAWNSYYYELPKAHGYKFALSLRDWAQTSEQTLQMFGTYNDIRQNVALESVLLDELWTNHYFICVYEKKKTL